MESLRALLNSIAVAFDLPILDWIQANLQSPLMDKIMPIITLFGDAGIFWIALSVLLLLFPKTRRIGLGMGIAAAVAAVGTAVGKRRHGGAADGTFHETHLIYNTKISYHTYSPVATWLFLCYTIS